MSNPGIKNAYFAWPTVTKLKNGRLAISASGYRRRHICPFGKAVISYSDDEGESYTSPAVVIDTVLDDRDAGMLAFGESGLMFTSFNNTVAFQRRYCKDGFDSGYLDSITPEEEAEAIGSTYRLSFDNGITFGEIMKSPVTSPHGPIELSDGTVLWLGRTFSPSNEHMIGKDRIEGYRVNLEAQWSLSALLKTLSVREAYLFRASRMQ